MRRIKNVLTALLIVAVPTALAALPPQHQRAAELVAIAQHQELIELFMAQGQLLDAIEYVAVDAYLVSGGECTLSVTIVDVPAEPNALPMVGARQFTLELGELNCG